MMYTQLLQVEKMVRDQFEKERLETLQAQAEKIRQDYLDRLKAEANSREAADRLLPERTLLVQRTIEAILVSQQGKSDFKEKLDQLLKDYSF